RADQCECVSGENPNNLVADLSPMSIDRAYCLASAEDGVNGLRGEDPGKQRADCAACTVDTKCIERVVISEDRLDFRHHQIADQSSDKADEQRGHGTDESCRGSDCYQSRDRARDCAQCARPSIFDPLREQPSDYGSCCAEVGGNKCARGKTAGSESAAGVESKPSHP